MKHPKAILYYVLFSAAAALSFGSGGCARPNKPDTTKAQGLVEVEDNTPAMTPAQREREYRAAYDAGVEMADKGRYAEALQAFERAQVLKPSSVEALFNLGACHEAIGDPLRAINIYRRVLDLQPDDADCYANLGTSFIKMYYRDRSPMWRKMARDAWQRSLTLKPDQPRVREFLAKSESME